MVKLRESALYSGEEEIANEERTDPMEELRPAKNRSFWRTTEGRSDKRANYKGSLEVGQGDARTTQDRINLVAWPFLCHKSRETYSKVLCQEGNPVTLRS